MSIVPATYFSEPIRRAQRLIGASPDSISLMALAQLRAAYDVLAADSERVQNGPSFQVSASTQAPFGIAPAIDLSIASSPPRAPSGNDLVATTPKPQKDCWAETPQAHR